MPSIPSLGSRVLRRLLSPVNMTWDQEAVKARGASFTTFKSNNQQGPVHRLFMSNSKSLFLRLSNPITPHCQIRQTGKEAQTPSRPLLETVHLVLG